MQQIMDSEYINYLYTHDTSKEFACFVRNHIQSTIELKILCVLSLRKITTPIRHANVKNLNCLFELESFNEWIGNTQYIQHLFRNTQCIGCKANVTRKDFGVDYVILNVLSVIKKFMDNKNYNDYNQQKIIYDPSRSKYYLLNKKTKENLLLPGCIPIYGIQGRYANVDPNLQPIVMNLGDTLSKMQQYLLKQKHQIIKGTPQEQEILVNKINTEFGRQPQFITKIFKQYTKVIEQGANSLRNDIVFAFERIDMGANNQGSALLLVYYVYYKIWQKFEINVNGDPFRQLEQALYIKDYNKTLGQHQIYVIGGKLPDIQQSNIFIRITLPKDPFDLNPPTILNAERLPNLKQEGYHYMGTIYQGAVFIFYGQARFINNHRQVDDKLLNIAQVYENNQWSDINIKPIPRFQGSNFIVDTPDYGKCMFFFGGVSHNPMGSALPACEQQSKLQIFQFKTKQFLYPGQGNLPVFDLKFMDSQQHFQKQLAGSVFTIPLPSSDNLRLIISGEFVKQKLEGKRQILNFDWWDANVTINQMLSLEPSEILLMPYHNPSNRSEYFTPVHDFEGCIAYNEFYTIHLKQDPNNFTTVSEVTVLKFNLTNGKFTQYPYVSPEESILRAEEFRKALPIQEDKAL